MKVRRTGRETGMNKLQEGKANPVSDADVPLARFKGNDSFAYVAQLFGRDQSASLPA